MQNLSYDFNLLYKLIKMADLHIDDFNYNKGQIQGVIVKEVMC